MGGPHRRSNCAKMRKVSWDFWKSNTSPSLRLTSHPEPPQNAGKATKPKIRNTNYRCEKLKSASTWYTAYNDIPATVLKYQYIQSHKCHSWRHTLPFPICSHTAESVKMSPIFRRHVSFLRLWKLTERWPTAIFGRTHRQALPVLN
jgi:hypothetical protein